MSKVEVEEIRLPKIGDIIKKNRAIFEYIYNSSGYRVGIVLAFPGIGKCHPKVGWALFREVVDKSINHTTVGEVPSFMEKVRELTTRVNNGESVEYALQTIIDYKISDFCNGVEECMGSAEDKLSLFDLALSRANYESWDFYVDRYSDSPHNKTDLRKNVIYYSTPEYGDTCVIHDAVLCKSIRKAVRKIEYRAYRYYK